MWWFRGRKHSISIGALCWSHPHSKSVTMVRMNTSIDIGPSLSISQEKSSASRLIGVSVCVRVSASTHTYLLLHRTPLHSQSPACCTRGPGLHNSWLLPYLTETYSERKDTSFFLTLGPSSSSDQLSHLVWTSSQIYRFDRGHPWHVWSHLIGQRTSEGAGLKASHLIANTYLFFSVIRGKEW